MKAPIIPKTPPSEKKNKTDLVIAPIIIPNPTPQAIPLVKYS